MPELKSERHHWWPECVSQFWKDESGKVHFVRPDGETIYAPPKNFGVIGNGHHIKMGDGEPSDWDHSFEHVFHEADNNFPRVIRWLDGLDRQYAQNPGTRKERLLAQPANDEQIKQLVESVVSLAVRSPMNRETAVRLAEHLRGPLPEKHRNVIIGMNMRNSHRTVVDNIGVRAKFAVLFSPRAEFIFGDGFFHNIRSPAEALHSIKILAPVTPHIAVLIARPVHYRTEPRLVTLVLDENETKVFNDTVQVYARNFLFYRSQKPELTDDFKSGKHLKYAFEDHPINRLIDDLSGVPSQQYHFSFPPKE